RQTKRQIRGVVRRFEDVGFPPVVFRRGCRFLCEVDGFDEGEDRGPLVLREGFALRWIRGGGRSSGRGRKQRQTRESAERATAHRRRPPALPYLSFLLDR